MGGGGGEWKKNPRFLNSSLDIDECLVSLPGRFVPKEEPRVPFDRLGGPQNRSGRFD
jgi:hypothetical protein